MLRNEVWLEAHPDPHGVLCLPCIEGRLGRPLRQSDFNDMPLNSWEPLRSRILELKP